MKVTIIGASGQGKVVAEIASLCGYKTIEFLDDNILLKKCGDWPVIGNVDNAIDSNGDIFVAIGDAFIRKRLIEKYYDRIVTLIHPDSIISNSVRIGKGTVVMAGAIINPYVTVGDGCIINTSSSIDHDCRLDNYVHVSVGAHLCGTVCVGSMTWIGAGTIINNNINGCDNCLLGSGTVVINDICDSGTYVGVPAKRIK